MSSHETALTRAEESNRALQNQLDPRWYPQFHIAAPAGWINDPNGLCHFDRRYHVFFQHHPASPQWGPMHWGHVTSEDLVTWRREPIALAPSEAYDNDGIWSGSAVVRDGRLEVFYTGNRWRNGVDGDGGLIQSQCRATSADGIHFTKRGVVVPAVEGLDNVRDPKVWWDGERWLMIFGVESADHRGQVWLYASEDLEAWTSQGVLYEDPDPGVYMLECPDLFPLGDRWVLIYGPMTHDRPRGLTRRNGHNVTHLIGDFDGRVFTAQTEPAPLDWGHHYYAPQTMVSPDGRRLMIGWLGEFAKPLASQTADAWSGQLGVPRELSLDENGHLRSRPVAELVGLREHSEDAGAFALGLNEDRVLIDDAGPVEIELEVDLAAGDAERVELRVHDTGAMATTVAYDDLTQTLALDLGSRGLQGRGVRYAPFAGEALALRVFVDQGSVEVFAADGAVSLSSLSFPSAGPRAVALGTVGGAASIRRCVVHRLRSGWEPRS